MQRTGPCLCRHRAGYCHESAAEACVWIRTQDIDAGDMRLGGGNGIASPLCTAGSLVWLASRSMPNVVSAVDS
jgi:hypothetical protein